MLREKFDLQDTYNTYITIDSQDGLANADPNNKPGNDFDESGINLEITWYCLKTNNIEQNSGYKQISILYFTDIISPWS